MMPEQHNDQTTRDLDYIYARFTDFLHENPSGEAMLLQWLKEKREREMCTVPHSD